MFGYPFRLKDSGDDYLVGNGQALDQLFLKNFAAQSIGAWLKDGPETRRRIACPQGAQGLGNGCGMMSEIVNDGDAVNLGFDFQAAFHALKSLQCLRDCLRFDSIMRGHGGGGCGVKHVIFSGQRKLQVGPVIAFAQHRPRSTLRLILNTGNLPVRTALHAIALYWAEGASNAFIYSGACVVCNDLAFARNQVHQTLERGFDGIEVLVDIGVIKFDRR